MSGNVWEWTYDKYFSNFSGETNDPVNIPAETDTSARVMRGGGWDHGAFRARSGYRGANIPEHRRPWVGGRLVKTVFSQ
jgi:formylglycine-generating enzyme required for sulfatase activity